MDFGLDPEKVSSVAQQAHGGMAQPIIIIGIVAALGFVGRLIFVAFGDRIAGINPLRGFSGWGLVGVTAAIFVGVVFVSGKERSLLINFKATVVDPFIVSVLERDSCDPARGKYCVVVFEDDREIVVNWYDRRVSMFEIANDLMMNPLLASRRPVVRPASGVAAAG